jgi:hypothetical protein
VLARRGRGPAIPIENNSKRYQCPSTRHQSDEYVVIEDMFNSAKVTALPVIAALLLAMVQLLTAPGAQAADRITIGMQLEPPILDPTANPAAAISEILYGNVFEGLVCFAAVAKFSLDRALESGSVNPQKSRLTKIRAVEVIDPYTLRILLKARSGGLLQSLAWGAFVMVSPQSSPPVLWSSRRRRIGGRRTILPPCRSSTSCSPLVGITGSVPISSAATCCP